MQLEVLGPWLAAPEDGSRGACSSYLVGYGGASVLLDCGPGTPLVLQERELTGRVETIVISHMDPDHILGLVMLASLLRTRGILTGEPPNRLTVYVPVEDGLKTLSSLEAVWKKDAGGSKPFADVFEVREYSDDAPIRVGDLRMEFTRTLHHRPCYSPRITSVLDGSNGTLVYSADTGYSPDMSEHSRSADLFLCEATMPEPDPLWTEKHGHLTGKMAGVISREAGVGRLVLTHLGSDRDTNLGNLESARLAFGGPVELARAGHIYEVDEV